MLITIEKGGKNNEKNYGYYSGDYDSFQSNVKSVLESGCCVDVNLWLLIEKKILINRKNKQNFMPTIKMRSLLNAV